MQKIILILNLLYFVNINANFLLTAPERILFKDFDKPETRCTSFCWGRGDFVVKFDYIMGQTSFNIVISKQLIKLLEPKEQNKLNIKEDDNNFCVYNCSNLSQEQLNLEKEIQNKHTNENYYLASPRIINSQVTPKLITVEELSKIISTKKFIFYTGAGISASSNVWTMNKLESELGIIRGPKEDREKRIKSFLDNALNNSQQLCKTFSEFCDLMFENPPTRVHEVVQKISFLKNCKIITENLDFLHQRTGILPVMAKPSIIKAEDIKEVEAIICIGLSFDDRGLLAFYKNNMPDGIIISIDLKQPIYIDSNDYFLQGDLQAILKELDKYIY